MTKTTNILHMSDTLLRRLCEMEKSVRSVQIVAGFKTQHRNDVAGLRR